MVAVKNYLKQVLTNKQSIGTLDKKVGDFEFPPITGAQNGYVLAIKDKDLKQYEWKNVSGGTTYTAGDAISISADNKISVEATKKAEWDAKLPAMTDASHLQSVYIYDRDNTDPTKKQRLEPIANAETDGGIARMQLARKYVDDKIYNGLDKTAEGFVLDARQGPKLVAKDVKKGDFEGSVNNDGNRVYFYVSENEADRSILSLGSNELYQEMTNGTNSSCLSLAPGKIYYQKDSEVGDSKKPEQEIARHSDFGIKLATTAGANEAKGIELFGTTYNFPEGGSGQSFVEISAKSESESENLSGTVTNDQYNALKAGALAKLTVKSTKGGSEIDVCIAIGTMHVDSSSGALESTTLYSYNKDAQRAQVVYFKIDSSTKVLSGKIGVDVGGSSEVSWGSIKGTINDQTDLKGKFDGKQNTITYGTDAPTGGENGDVYIKYTA